MLRVTAVSYFLAGKGRDELRNQRCEGSPAVDRLCVWYHHVCRNGLGLFSPESVVETVFCGVWWTV